MHFDANMVKRQGHTYIIYSFLCTHIAHLLPVADMSPSSVGRHSLAWPPPDKNDLLRCKARRILCPKKEGPSAPSIEMWAVL